MVKTPPQLSTPSLSKWLSLTTAVYIAFFCGFAIVISQWPGGAGSLIEQYGLFFFLGLVGALVANSTGAGGGVIFIPFFSALSISAEEAIATSIAIQCFGMTAGSVSWLKYLQLKTRLQEVEHAPIFKLLVISGFPTVIGILCAQYLIPTPSLPIESIFGGFSIVFGILLLLFTAMKGRGFQGTIRSTSRTESIWIVGTCFFGGILTTWISVGVGEGIALLLFFLGFPAYIAVAIGVYTSSMAVLTAVNFHIQHDNIITEVVLFAGLAAFVGGYIARYITNKVGGYNLKLFFALWITASGFLVI